MQRILRTLEEKTLILKVLDQCLATTGVKVLIGDEIDVPEASDISLITSVYSDIDGNRGFLGVMGPKRIDYARIVPLVEFTSKIVTDVLCQRKQ